MKIEVNPIEAGKYATAICQANDHLTNLGNVSFSSGTTVQGNSVAQTTFHQLQTGISQMNGLLSRDVQNIHSAVASFERSDQQAKQLFENPF